MPLSQADIVTAFQTRYGASPEWVVRAPGRVNLIGEHTDYNDGFVLPLAINRAVWIAGRSRPERTVSVYSIDFQQDASFPLENIEKARDGWVEYLKGVVWSLSEAGYALSAWEGVLQGDVPLGAGLSSSAALEMATARALAADGFPWDPAKIALLAQRAENRWIGVNCGIMDQLISAAGRNGHALLIDCRSLETSAVPFPPGAEVVVLDTGTRRGLVDSEYNERRASCEKAARQLGVKALRDVSLGEFHARAAELDSLIARRAKHVITENQRTLEAAAAMRLQDPVTVGSLMDQSHASLRDDYEVSSPALDAMVEAARTHAACFGARMTGAGFGGCAVALIEAQGAEDFVSVVSDRYRRETGNAPAVYVCQATNGAERFLL